VGKVLLRLRFLVPWLRSSSLGTDSLNQKGQKGGISTVKMTGIYQRKDIEFADQQAVERAKVLLTQHPWTIANTPEFAAEYAAIYGADELTILRTSCSGGKFNLVQSPIAKWCIGGVYVPIPPKPEEILKDGYVWQDTPYGRRQIPKTQATIQPAAAMAEITTDVKQQLAAIVFDAVTDALEAWSKKT